MHLIEIWSVAPVERQQVLLCSDEDVNVISERQREDYAKASVSHLRNPTLVEWDRDTVRGGHVMRTQRRYGNRLPHMEIDAYQTITEIQLEQA